MDFLKGIKSGFLQAVRECYQLELNEGEIQINAPVKGVGFGNICE